MRPLPAFLVGLLLGVLAVALVGRSLAETALDRHEAALVEALPLVEAARQDVGELSFFAERRRGCDEGTYGRPKADCDRLVRLLIAADIRGVVQGPDGPVFLLETDFDWWKGLLHCQRPGGCRGGKPLRGPWYAVEGTYSRLDTLRGAAAPDSARPRDTAADEPGRMTPPRRS